MALKKEQQIIISEWITDVYIQIIKGHLPLKSSKARNFNVLQNSVLASLKTHDCPNRISSSEDGMLIYFFVFRLKSEHSTVADWNRLIAKFL